MCYQTGTCIPTVKRDIDTLTVWIVCTLLSVSCPADLSNTALNIAVEPDIYAIIYPLRSIGINCTSRLGLVIPRQLVRSSLGICKVLSKRLIILRATVSAVFTDISFHSDQ